MLMKTGSKAQYRRNSDITDNIGYCYKYGGICAFRNACYYCHNHTAQYQSNYLRHYKNQCIFCFGVVFLSCDIRFIFLHIKNRYHKDHELYQKCSSHCIKLIAVCRYATTHTAAILNTNSKMNLLFLNLLSPSIYIFSNILFSDKITPLYPFLSIIFHRIPTLYARPPMSFLFLCGKAPQSRSVQNFAHFFPLIFLLASIIHQENTWCQQKIHFFYIY